MRTRLLVALLAAVPAALAADAATAERRGSYTWVDDPGLAPMPTGGGFSSLIFLNRCEDGCRITPGREDSRTNRSSIINSTVNISAFDLGDAAWDEVVACVNDVYEPYGVTITDQDPGNTPHYEAIVAGVPAEIGRSGIGGVSPFTCNVIDNAITYSFANIYSDPIEICWTVAQETAHAFGLEHELLCSDPMTYLQDCPVQKYFQDEAAQCGEFEARPCDCGGSRQNSHAMLFDLFGPGTPTPPTVSLVRPTDGASVNPAFPIEVAADDNVRVARVELYLDGSKIAERTTTPWVFNAPADLPGGPVAIEVRAFDNRDATSSASIDVNVGEPCTEGSCEDGQVCVSGNCLEGPSTPGGLGSVCGDSDDCDSNACADDGEQKLCVIPCGDGCPDGFRCRGEDGPSPVCWPSEDGGGCAATPTGARSSSSSSPAPWGLAVCALAALTLWRRRRPR